MKTYPIHSEIIMSTPSIPFGSSISSILPLTTVITSCRLLSMTTWRANSMMLEQSTAITWAAPALAANMERMPVPQPTSSTVCKEEIPRWEGLRKMGKPRKLTLPCPETDACCGTWRCGMWRCALRPWASPRGSRNGHRSQSNSRGTSSRRRWHWDYHRWSPPRAASSPHCLSSHLNWAWCRSPIPQLPPWECLCWPANRVRQLLACRLPSHFDQNLPFSNFFGVSLVFHVEKLATKWWDCFYSTLV